MKKLALPIVVSALTAAGSVWAFHSLQHSDTTKKLFSDNKQTTKTGLHFASNSGQNIGQPVDFTYAAENTVKSVVHIRTTKAGKTVMARDPFADFFGMGGGVHEYKMPDAQGGGSGVIISSDGYVLTNNHVVAGADEVQVTFNNRNTQTAKVVGTDPSTDLAVLKIDGKDFPPIVFGNSDEVKLGQWVLAVGFPLNLDATVTAGIVSAKGRSIGINQRQSNRAIESFIQTDAAVNPGNSGGPLVNTQGQLIGINSAIASPTGTYAGYSYAVPSNLARKVADDIIKFGSVRRGYIGASLLDLDKISEKQAEELGVTKDKMKVDGVYVADVLKGSGAEKAGLKKGDVITAINGVATRSSSVLMEQVARYHPGDKVQVDFVRGNSAQKIHVELKDQQATESLTAAAGGGFKAMGATLRPLNKQELSSFGLSKGLIVADPGKGALASSGVKSGFVIFSINDQEVATAAELREALEKGGGAVTLKGTYEGNRRGQYYYSFPYSGGSALEVD
jgi:serine protease Do